MRRPFVAALVIVTLAGSMGCATHPHTRYRADDDVVIIDRAPPHSYYLIDTQRRLCFLQEGRAVTPIRCQEVPGAASYVTNLDAASELGPVLARAPVAAASDDARSRFEAAYIDLYCARALGDDRSGPEILEIYRLDMESYARQEALIAADHDAWSWLQTIARDGCLGP